ncbi:MAG: cache domain-containing protein [Methanospirillaceae archaeon]|nr:cache domain-containing protein [Methanospirillaceae archaeon]
MNRYQIILIVLFISLLLPGTGATVLDEKTDLLFAASDAISDILTQIDTLLADSQNRLKDDELSGDTATKVLSDLISVSSVPGIRSAVTVDTDGIIRAASPIEYTDIIGTDISYQSHIITGLHSKQPVRSDYFRAVEGFDAVTRSYPIFSDDNIYRGMVILVYDPQFLYEATLNHLLDSSTDSACILNPDGLILYCSDEFLQPNTSIITDYPHIPDLQKAGSEMIRTYAGSMTINWPFEKGADPTSGEILWNTVDSQVIGIISPSK